MALTKQILSEELQEDFGLSALKALEFVGDLFEGISSELEKGNTVNLQGFGQFRLLDKEARPGRNPKTNQPHEITERRVCVLKPGVWLKDAAGVVASSHTLDLDN